MTNSRSPISSVTCACVSVFARLDQLGAFLCDLCPTPARYRASRNPRGPRVFASFTARINAGKPKATSSSTPPLWRGGAGCALGGFYLFPVLELVASADFSRLSSPNTWGWRATILSLTVARDICKGENARPHRPSVRDRPPCKQQVAQLTFKRGPVLFLNRVGNLVGFFDCVGRDARGNLVLCPMGQPLSGSRNAAMIARKRATLPIPRKDKRVHAAWLGSFNAPRVAMAATTARPTRARVITVVFAPAFIPPQSRSAPSPPRRRIRAPAVLRHSTATATPSASRMHSTAAPVPLSQP